jgi:hypothetical protein
MSHGRTSVDQLILSSDGDQLEKSARHLYVPW